MNPGILQKPKRLLSVWPRTLLMVFALGVLCAGISLAMTAYNAVPVNDFWSAVRQGPQEIVGMTFRDFREDILKGAGGWFFAAFILLLGGHYLIFGPHRYPEPEESSLISRFTPGERTIHWLVTSLFILLAITGLLLLYGRHIVTPILGQETFASFAKLLKLVHNFLGPAFVVAVFLMVVKWWRDGAVFRDYDWDWVKSGGGYLKKGVYAPAGRFNAGQKGWFWAVILLGLATAVTGLILDFGNLFGDQWGLRADVATKDLFRYTMIVHGVVTVLFVGGVLVHMYMAVFAAPGSLSGMLNGKVEENWAKEHHDLWYVEQKAKEAGVAE